ncbi:hypothetical protein BSZ40_10910 [Buchananella hordeovulneris]|uniref:Uncharacterized protein n=2 Tax=Buchananella hordeovulneris TaxID=52770 RepID=A0A1Q5PTF1_9ACTO|nr:hypothetical protein BSZ40_10910 [Buchananella hordeovulneris]
MAVDYLSRAITSHDRRHAFQVSLLGARLLGRQDTAYALLNQVDGLTHASIRAACKLTGFDVVYRAGASSYKPVEGINPDNTTINNIAMMVGRLSHFFETNHLLLDGFDLAGAYTKLIRKGDGDVVTSGGMWDVKVSRSKPSAKNTLQILIYWLMGLRSIHPQFKQVEKIGIVNPRLGKVWEIAVDMIPPETIQYVSTEVIGYKRRRSKMLSAVIEKLLTGYGANK